MELIKFSDIEGLIQPKKEDFIKLTSSEAFTKELSFAVQAINSNEKLRDCSKTPQGKTSILQAIFNVALTGLSLNPLLKFAALTPRYIRDLGWQCILMPQYQGLVKLITDTGSVKNVYAYNAMQEDEFTVILGSSVEIIHKPKYKSKEITHAYAVAILQDGSKQIEVMTRDDLDYIRGLSDSYKAFIANKASSSIWVDFHDEMCRKTVLKRIVKYLPKSNPEKWEQLNKAIEEDNNEYSAGQDQVNYIEQLINNSTYDHDTQAVLHDKIRTGITLHEARAMIRDLEANQVDRISGGLNYNSTSDITQHTRKLANG